MKTLGILCMLAGLGLGAAWVAIYGPRLATQWEVPTQVTFTDDFGDEVTKTKWEKGFVPGLDIVGPSGGGLIGLGVVLLFVHRRRQRAA